MNTETDVTKMNTEDDEDEHRNRSEHRNSSER